MGTSPKIGNVSTRKMAYRFARNVVLEIIGSMVNSGRRAGRSVYVVVGSVGGMKRNQASAATTVDEAAEVAN